MNDVDDDIDDDDNDEPEDDLLGDRMAVINIDILFGKIRILYSVKCIYTRYCDCNSLFVKPRSHFTKRP